MTSCWNCAKSVPPASLFCTDCSALQPPAPERDAFQVLEVAPGFELDMTALEQSFKRLSRLLHPDRFATATALERRYSLEHATALNDAYRLLKAPLKRAEYLLRRAGRNVGQETSRSNLPFEFMEQLMERREALTEARLEGDQATIERIVAEIRAELAVDYQQIAQGFASPTPPGPEALDALEQACYRLRYSEGILNDYAGGAASRR